MQILLKLMMLEYRVQQRNSALAVHFVVVWFLSATASLHTRVNGICEGKAMHIKLGGLQYGTIAHIASEIKLPVHRPVRMKHNFTVQYQGPNLQNFVK